MPFLIWNDNYSVNIPELDTEHQKIVDLINDVHDAFISGKGMKEISKVIEGLIKYTETHFVHEENYMQEIGFEDFNTHKEKHYKLIEEVRMFGERLQNDEKVGFMEVMTFLREWLIDHIQTEDMMYAPVEQPVQKY